MNPTAGVWRRLGAMFYDTLLVVASLMVVTALFLPLTGGEAITADQVGSAFEYLYRSVLLVVIVLYFGWPWTRSGQTVGMMAWRLRLERNDGSMVRWSDVPKRLAGATVSLLAAGMGYWWIWIDRERRTWHDRWTDTRVVVLPRRQR